MDKFIKQQIFETIEKLLDLKKYHVFIFGSRAKGTAGERADIDIGIEGKESVPAEKLLIIMEELNKLPILYKIDVVDFQTAAEKFKQEAKKNIEYLN